MKKLIPVMTEKSMKDAESGKYTFWVDKNLTKDQIKSLIRKIFEVDVVSVKTLNMKEITKMTIRRRKKTVKPKKKAIITLKEKQKIDLFEETKKKSK